MDNINTPLLLNQSKSKPINNNRINTMNNAIPAKSILGTSYQGYLDYSVNPVQNDSSIRRNILEYSLGDTYVVIACLTREEKRRKRRATLKYKMAHAKRERLRVESFNSAFVRLKKLLPILPPDKKLSKIEILRLAITYIYYLRDILKC
ncbi:unnamed protein product [Gordionus sp. m RMFG-2023]|uniref:neurogenic differentiation factor 4-like n=1 Tax=Gordionus sp. m RMFG-2023 TaxID=3053472 RepID=UPI0030E427A5